MDKLDYNKTIIKILKDCNIPKDEGLIILTALYFSLNPKVMFETQYYKNIFALLGPQFIFNQDMESGKIKWLIPLFGEEDIGFEWVKEWMDLFKAVNPERRGEKKEVINRFTRFFKQYPLYTKDEIFSATKLYLSNVNPQYCKKSHKFIFDLADDSMLLNHLETLQHKKEGVQLVLN
jgi:hypothetical protein